MQSCVWGGKVAAAIVSNLTHVFGEVSWFQNKFIYPQSHLCLARRSRLIRPSKKGYFSTAGLCRSSRLYAFELVLKNIEKILKAFEWGLLGKKDILKYFYLVNSLIRLFDDLHKIKKCEKNHELLDQMRSVGLIRRVQTTFWPILGQIRDTIFSDPSTLWARMFNPI